MRHRSFQIVLRVLPAIPVLVLGLVASASAQSVIPPQLSQYLCTNFDAIKTLAPVVALVAIGAALAIGLIKRHSNLVVDLVIGGLIALVIINLPTILQSVGLNTGCS